MVNMGAIVMCTLIRGATYEERFQRLLELTRKLAGDESIGVDEAVYRSEKSHGSKNRALAYLLKSYGLLEDDVEEVLDCYFRGGCRCPTSGFSPPPWPGMSTQSS